MPTNRAEKDDYFKDPIAQEDRWHLANYAYTLRDNAVAPTQEGLIRVQGIKGPLPDTVDAMQWTEAPAVNLYLVPNIIQGQRLFTPLNSNITVRALYNETEIAFLLEVHDRTDSRPGEPISTHIHDQRLPMYADAFAIQFPNKAGIKSTTLTKPQLAHGNHDHGATQLYWNAGSVEPPKPTQAIVFDVAGIGDPTTTQQGNTGLMATGRWERGRWRVLMKRPRHPKSTDVRFDEGRYIPVAFANWDGNNGEIGSRHTLTSWYWLVLQPQGNPLRSYGLPVAIGLGILLLGLWVLRRSRRQPPSV
jgi:DMSO reductase family type II enzyme heme b subunit